MLESITRKAVEIWVGILIITILLVPNVADWGSAWSTVGGYDLSKVPLVFVIIIIFSFALYLTKFTKK